MKTVFNKTFNNRELTLKKGRCYYFVVMFDQITCKLMHFFFLTQEEAARCFVRFDILNRG